MLITWECLFVLATISISFKDILWENVIGAGSLRRHISAAVICIRVQSMIVRTTVFCNDHKVASMSVRPFVRLYVMLSDHKHRKSCMHIYTHIYSVSLLPHTTSLQKNFARFQKKACVRQVSCEISAAEAFLNKMFIYLTPTHSPHLFGCRRVCMHVVFRCYSHFSVIIMLQSMSNVD